ncbi:hypothetical protein [Bradyrhizobium sp. 144]|uniref:hypothetical protein n=1 Tax=Bradyrhizobium sp. 144 TaxID=2782620 RepID=UPI001FF93EA8|nr:hypothetical protein [Bradyrhizobium sp. 144]MCK1698567.1 hypothetical protein [Bradyrhizobium sp. 144]
MTAFVTAELEGTIVAPRHIVGLDIVFYHIEASTVFCHPLGRCGQRIDQKSAVVNHYPAEEQLWSSFSTSCSSQRAL